MNKLIIFLLAVGLVSVHGIVRREAPATEKNYFDELQKSWENISKQANEKMKEVFNPDEMKKTFGSVVDNVSKTIEELRKKVEASSVAPPKA